eukprot:scaffold21367_cov78-Skeletonema_dohrnii-CCMP3373.AAC.1
MAITFIDHEETQPPAQAWLDKLLTRVSRNVMFTFSEHTTLDTTVRETYTTPPTTPPSPQHDVVDLTGMTLQNNASAGDDDSLELQDDDMSTSSK